MHALAQVGLAVAVLGGIRLMSKPDTAVPGNRLAALSLLIAILLVLLPTGAITLPLILISLAVGGVIGLVLALRVTMLQMPQMVALLNGLGGAASMLTALAAVTTSGATTTLHVFISGGLAIVVGGVTLSGSLVAAGKLHRLLPQSPVRGIPRWPIIAGAPIMLLVPLVLAGGQLNGFVVVVWLSLLTVGALAFGVVLTLPVGGADMPVTISLLNSTSGVAASICGFVVNDAFLVAAGAIVGAAGLILTQVMCKAMNRSIVQILKGTTVTAQAVQPVQDVSRQPDTRENAGDEMLAGFDPVETLINANSVIIIPGYGMALGEAETQVRDLYELLERLGKEVKFAIHPVAGRMPGHMTVLLADVDIPYDKMVQMEAVNAEFTRTDVALIVGACDVVNPAANTAKGTPIYGMPILNAHEAKRIIVCNADAKPGYSGIENPLYKRSNVVLLLGNACQTLSVILEKIKGFEARSEVR